MPAKNCTHRAVLAGWLAVAGCVLLPTGGALAQSPEEHASHHPGAAPVAGAMPGGARGMGGMGPPAGAGGMMGRGPGAGMGHQ